MIIYIINTSRNEKRSSTVSLLSIHASINALYCHQPRENPNYKYVCQSNASYAVQLHSSSRTTRISFIYRVYSRHNKTLYAEYLVESECWLKYSARIWGSCVWMIFISAHSPRILHSNRTLRLCFATIAKQRNGLSAAGVNFGVSNCVQVPEIYVWSSAKLSAR